MWKLPRATALNKSFGALCVLCLTALPVAAQTTGVIYGTVTDATAGLMPGVSVTLERDATPPLTAVTDKDGNYVFASVSLGTYRMTFWQDGFKKAVRNGLILTAGPSLRVDQRMEAGTYQEPVAVPASATVAYDRPTRTGSTFTKDIVTAVPAQQSDVNALLARSATYLADFEKAFSVVVAEESYVQTMLAMAGGRTGRLQRTLRSDVLQTSVGQSDWVAFRDVFEVDGQPVRDRDTRLQKLFLDAPSEALAQSRRIVAESARYNIGSLQRNINVPTMALTYLRAGNQSRSTFKAGGAERVDGINAVILSFVEKSKPTIVRSGSRDLPATGRFWIEPDSGRVLKTEVSIAGAGSPAKITVTYGPVPKLTTWAPVVMREQYDGKEIIHAEATYSNFRQFSVAVAEKIKH